MAGIYIHIPFCKNKCHYCDFYSVASTIQRVEVLNTINKELELRKNYLSDLPLETLYFGGGTPSICTPEELLITVNKVKQHWGFENLTEFTLEANPENLTPEYLVELRKLGVNRLSIGVQSFSDNQLKFVNRNHTSQIAIEAIENARAAGFFNISIDLMYGIPGMTLAELEQNLQQAIALNPEHISAYHLGIEEKTVFGNRKKRGILQEISEEESRQHYAMVCKKLGEAGYEHYEISNFAKPGMRSRHNSNYWNQTPYLGIGPSAHSYCGNSRQWNHANNAQYLNTFAENKFYETEILSERDIFNEYLMTGLRTSSGVSLSYIRDRFGRKYFEQTQIAIQKMILEDLICIIDDKIIILEHNYLISDQIIGNLFA